MNQNQFYNQHLFNDISDSTGDGIRRKNKLKEANLMNLAVNFTDPAVLAKIREVFTNLSPEEMLELKDHLDSKGYLKKANSNNNSQKIIGKIAQIALTSTPENEKLKQIKEKYNKNLTKIDKIKMAMTQIHDEKELNKFYFILEKLNEENVKLFQLIDKVREETLAK